MLKENIGGENIFMSVMRDKLNWNAVKGFVRSRDAQKSIIILVAYIITIQLFFWAFQTYCLDFLEVDTFQWVFSTLAQVFGALLGLLGVTTFFIFDTFNGLKEKDERLRDKLDGAREKVEEVREKVEGLREKTDGHIDELEGLREKLKGLEDGLNSFIERFDRGSKKLGGLREKVIKTSIYALGTTSFVVIYSIIILPLSYFLITKKLIAGMIISFLGILFPIITIFFLISLIVLIKDIASLYESYGEMYIPFKGLYKRAESMYKRIEDL